MSAILEFKNEERLIAFMNLNIENAALLNRRAVPAGDRLMVNGVTMKPVFANRLTMQIGANQRIIKYRRVVRLVPSGEKIAYTVNEKRAVLGLGTIEEAMREEITK